MIQHRQLDDIYRERVDKFHTVIRKWQNQERSKIEQKSKDERQYEHHKFVREHTEKYDEEYLKQNKNIEVDAKIKKSRKTNELRLSKMKLRFEIIEKVQNQVLNELSEISKDQGKYLKLLEDLLVQGMTRMLEKNIEVKCLPRDASIVKKAMERSQLLFGNICEVKTQLTLSPHSLPDSDIGGLVLTSNNGKIVCNNTLKARLDHCLQLALPEVRTMLFPKASAK